MRTRALGLLGLAVLTVGLSGCAEVEQVDQTYTARNAWIGILFIAAVTLTPAVIGAGMILNSWSEVLRPRPKKKRKPSSKPTVEVKDGSATPLVTLCGGVVLVLVGAVVSLLAVPSAMLSYVTVAPDKLVLRDALLWFSNGPREIPFASIGDLQFDKEEKLTRRGRRVEEVMYIMHSGATEKISMSPIHKGARPYLEENLRKFRETRAVAQNAAAVQQNPNQNQNVPPVAPVPEAPQAPAGQPGLTQVTNIGRFAAGTKVTARHGAAFEMAEVLRVYRERKLDVQFVSNNEIATVSLDEATPAASTVIPANGPGSELPPGDVAAGTKLLGHYDGGWFPVEVVGPDGPRSLVIVWTGETGQHSVPRSWLRVPPPGELQTILPVPGAPATATSKPAAQVPGEYVQAADQVMPGDRLLAQFGQQWLPVTVLEVNGDGRLKIHWEGYADSFDEVLEREKLRFPKK